MTPSRRAFISNLFVAPAVLKLGLYMPVKKQFEIPVLPTFTINQPELFQSPVKVQSLNIDDIDYANDDVPQFKIIGFAGNMKIGDLVTGANGYKETIVLITNGDWRQTTD